VRGDDRVSDEGIDGLTVSTRTIRGARGRVLAALGGVFALALAVGATAVPAQAAEAPLAVTPGACVPADV
jgi:hypothetical protein